MFTKRDYQRAEKIAGTIAHLWMDGRLTSRAVRYALRQLHPDYTLDSGAYRTTVLMPKVVVKVPHLPESIKSTVLEYKLFQAVQSNRMIMQHFPNTMLIQVDGMPVLLQERVPMIATHAVDQKHPLSRTNWRNPNNPVHTAVETFAKQLGLGDTHYGNYGWRKNQHGYYPVFIDCELGTGMMDVTPKQIQRTAKATTRWGYGV